MSKKAKLSKFKPDSAPIPGIIEGDEQDNILNGTSGDDTLYGYAGNDTLYGDAGNDVLYGGLGDDELFGGEGNDIYYVDSPVDTVNENANEGLDTVYASCSYTLESDVENLILTGNSGPITIDGNNVYGNPLGWQNLLDHAQGDNTFEYWSDCGIVASENILIQSGLMETKTEEYNKQYLDISTMKFVQGNTDASETYLVNYAKENDLCTESNLNPHNNGGTSVLDQIDILAGNGVSSHYEFLTLEKLGDYVKNNHAVIAEIDANVIWDGISSGGINHAVSVTGVSYNTDGDIEGFYICDSGTMGMPEYVPDRDGNGIHNDDAARFISYDLMKDAFYYFRKRRDIVGLSVITDTSTKEFLDDIDGTGNELANIITGNAGSNTLYGMSGNDELYGKGGNDTLIGGLGDDILYGGFGDDSLIGGLGDDILYGESGNNIYEFSVGDGIDTIFDKSGVSDSLKFDVANNLISFSLTQDNLLINYGNNGDQVTVQGQDSIEYFVAGDNSYITFDTLNETIQQMAAFGTGTETILPNANDTQNTQDLTAYLVDSWQYSA